MKKLLSIVFASMAALTLLLSRAYGGDINPGLTLQDGSRLTAAQLGLLVSQATIQPSFYTSQTASGTNLQNGDTLLVVSAGGVFRRLVGTQVINNPGIFTSAPQTTNFPNYGWLLYYDPTNGLVTTIFATNFLTAQASNIPVANFKFTATNGSSGNTNLPLLPAYTIGNWFRTNNQTEWLTWDSNGVPSYVYGSNLVAAIAYGLGTNAYIPYQWSNTFQPWLIYGTNAASNIWGYYTNFPVTNLFFTNNAFTQTNLPQTISNQDTIPFNASAQGNTNTTMTMEALYEYLTNRNTLPPYAVARVQFSGVPVAQNCTNVDTTKHFFEITNNTFSGITAVSWQFAGTSTATLPSTPQITSNTVYYVVPVATNSNWLLVYTNFTDAGVPRNEIVPTGSASATPGQNVLLSLTNFTSFNADPIQLCTAASINTGVYGISYRTNLSTTNYYLTGSAVFFGQPTWGFSVQEATDGVYSTNQCHITTIVDSAGAQQPNRAQVLIQPQ